MQTVFTFIVPFFFITGYKCDVSDPPVAPVSIDALVGSDVTLAVSHGGDPQPVVTWFTGGLPVAIWTIGDGSGPDVAPDHSSVLKVEPNGSLTLQDVPLGYNGTYIVEMTAIGKQRVRATFHLFVYDLIRNVSVHTDSDEAVEGAQVFSFYYSTAQGEAREVQWFFNGVQLENGSHYSISGKNLTINQPGRNDTGGYSVVLTNPFSSETHHTNITVLYGPDMPVLKVSPTKATFVSGDSVFLSCRADGVPPPSAAWLFNGLSVPAASGGDFNLTGVTTNQSGVYTCVLTNTRTEAKLRRNITLDIYEVPRGKPSCSVQAMNGSPGLQFLCLWPGGAPAAQLSFPSLSTNDSGEGHFSVTPANIQSLNGKEIICRAGHPLIQTECSIIPRGPDDFLPIIFTDISEDEQMTVAIRCFTQATPTAVVHWLKDGHRLENGPKHQISINTSQLSIRDFNASSTDLDTYTCIAMNPLGSRVINTTLLGPQISNSSIFLSDALTEVTLKWEVPCASVITSFAIQLKGPDLIGSPRSNHGSEFRTIKVMPGLARTTKISGLDPKSTYYLRIIPEAGRIAGKQSEQHRIQPDFGLSEAAIAGICAGIPCSVILLLVILSLFYCGKLDVSSRYPVSAAVEKVICQSDVTDPHHFLPERQKPLPEFEQPERLSPMPNVITKVRLATTV